MSGITYSTHSTTCRECNCTKQREGLCSCPACVSSSGHRWPDVLGSRIAGHEFMFVARKQLQWAQQLLRRKLAVFVSSDSHPFSGTPFAAADHRASPMQGFLVCIPIWLQAVEQDCIAPPGPNECSTPCTLRHALHSFLHSTKTSSCYNSGIPDCGPALRRCNANVECSQQVSRFQNQGTINQNGKRI